MSDDEIQHLIDRLNTLQVETAAVITALADTRRREQQRKQDETTQRRNIQPSVPAPIKTPERCFSIGDKVIIVSPQKFKHDRRATVTRIVFDRVYIRTNDNFHTWRKSKNLRLALDPSVTI
jgi:exosome complex RNA-binding protein Rrp42 (RNase PH superfamily)